MSRVLIACEESQRVTIEMRSLGIEAYSCDLLPCSGGHPEWHLQQDVTPLLQKKWDMIITFPPCTHLSRAGALYWKKKQADGRQQQAFEFVLAIWNAPCDHIAIENPIGWLNSHWKKPTQIIQPYHYGDPYIKATCLWLKGLPPLLPILTGQKMAKPQAHYIYCGMSLHKDGTRRVSKLPALKHRSSIERSKTFPGVARAMAMQWGKFFC